MELTPKEKAKELFDKYQIAGSKWYIEQTKEYALLCINEVLKALNWTPYLHTERIKYWNKVKIELNKL